MIMNPPNDMPRFGCVLNPLDENPRIAVIYPRRGKSVLPSLIAKHYKAAKGKEESEFSPNIIIIDELIN